MNSTIINIHFNGDEIPLCLSLTTMREFQLQTGVGLDKFDETLSKSIDAQFQLMYIAAQVGARRKGIEFKYSKAQFEEVFDTCFAEFIAAKNGAPAADDSKKN